MNAVTTLNDLVTAPYARRVSADNSYWYVGHLFSFLADASDTGGQLAVLEILARQGGEPPRHIHHRDDEAFYVLEGEITFYVGNEVYYARPGTFVYAPHDVPHSFTFETEVIRMLVLLTPGGGEVQFKNPRFSEPAQAPILPLTPTTLPDEAAFTEELAHNGIEIVGPPGSPLDR